MNPLSEFIEALGLTGVWTYLILFLGASCLMIWRLEALLDHGLEGTALGTLVMPYCSGLGNLLFVAVVANRGVSPHEIAINCLVNNVTNLTLVLALPALLWGLGARGGAPGKGSSRKQAAAQTAQRLSRLSLLLTLAALVFFSGVAWALARDGRLDRNDGLVLIGIFLFWQCFQVFDVLKHNVRQNRSFGLGFYVDALLVLACAAGLYVSIDWLVGWVAERGTGFVSVQHLGWLSGWLMVLPNAMVAFYYAATRRPDIVYASQVGDCHICIPLCLGIAAILRPIPAAGFFDNGLAILAITAVAHAVSLVVFGGLPRWLGWPLLLGYAWFVGAGLGG